MEELVSFHWLLRYIVEESVELKASPCGHERSTMARIGEVCSSEMYKAHMDMAEC